MDKEQKGPIGEARELVEDYFKPTIVTVEDPLNDAPGVPFIAAGGGMTPIDPAAFDPWLTAPRARSGTAELTTLDSLIAHTNRFKDADSIIYANDSRDQPSLMTVFDYHRAGAESDPRFGDHRGVFRFPLSDEWKAWTRDSGKQKSMAEFAEFLEDRIVDVTMLEADEPIQDDLEKLINVSGGADTIASPNRLLELSRGLKVNEDSRISEAVTLASGEGHIRFTSEHRTEINGAAVKVPTLFLIAIPIFNKGAFYRLAARLRYRKGGEGLKFWYDLWRPDRSFDHAFNEAAERAQTETGLPLIFGKPE